MASKLRHHAVSLSRAILALVVAVPLVMTEVAPPAAAQDFGWLGGIFGGQPRPPADDTYRRTRKPPSSYDPAPRRHAQKKKPSRAVQAPEPGSAPKAQPAAPPPPKNATVFVNVFGDIFGQQLANGLDDVLADKSDIGVVKLARGSSGIVNDSYYNWPKAVDELLERQSKLAAAKPDEKPGQAKSKSDGKDANRIDVAVMMIGSNDRQPITKDGQRLQPGSDEWTAEYKKRVLAICDAFRKKKIPLVWVGLPIVKSDDFADDMAALNDIFREAAAQTGAAYVDTWEAFSDANGDFSPYGPDITGQTVRLRTADGIYFTKAGTLKLAHFVEAPVRRDLDGKVPAPQLPTADAPTGPKDTKPGQPAVAVAKPDAGPIKNLSDLPAAKDGHLTDVTAVHATPGTDSPVVTPAKGQSESPPVGRADNFRWPSGGSGPPLP